MVSFLEEEGSEGRDTTRGVFVSFRFGTGGALERLFGSLNLSGLVNNGLTIGLLLRGQINWSLRVMRSLSLTPAR